MANDGRNQYGQSDQGRRRGDRPQNHWHQRSSAYELGQEDFRFTVLSSGPNMRRARLDRETTAASWTWEQAALTGSLSAQPARGQMKIVEGEEIQCDVSRTNGVWREVWTMIVQNISHSFNAGSFDYTLADQTQRTQEGRSDYRYKAKKHDHPDGWLCHQIARDVARQNKIPVGELAKGHYRIKTLDMKNASPLSVISAAYKKEREQTGRRFVIDLHKGSLNVYPLRYSRRLLQLGGMLLDANVVHTLKGNLVTVLTARATVDKKNADKKHDKKKGKSKLAVKVRSDALVKRYGYIHREVDFDAKDEDDLRHQAKRYLVEHAKPLRELTLTSPGMWKLRRGDAIRVRLPDEGLRDRIVFVRNVSHNVAAGDYTMEITLRFGDPIEDARKERALIKRCNKARRKNRKMPDDCPKSTRDHNKPKPGRNNNRQDQHQGAPQ